VICEAPLHQEGRTKIVYYPAGDCMVEEKVIKLKCPNGCKQSGASFSFEEQRF
jgi:hypothetical protein